MKRKYLIMILEIVLISVALFYYVIKIMIPEYRASQGSSDTFIRSSKYQNMIEVVINETTDFGIILDKEGKINHLFFFDNSSVVLYNKNIENQTIEVGLHKMIPILIENHLLSSGSSITIYRDKDDFYSSFEKIWDELIRKYSVETNILEKVQSINDRAIQLGIDTTSFESMMVDLDFYSKEMIKNYKEDNKTELNQVTSKELANKVYMKIENMVMDEKIHDLDRDKVDISITMIPADSNHNYYPTGKSWYYVKDGKVYAFIEFLEDDKSYSYCYSGSIDLRVEGECSS